MKTGNVRGRKGGGGKRQCGMQNMNRKAGGCSEPCDNICSHMVTLLAILELCSVKFEQKLGFV